MNFGVLWSCEDNGLVSQSIFLYNHALAEERCKVVAQMPQARYTENFPVSTAFT